MKPHKRSIGGQAGGDISVLGNHAVYSDGLHHDRDIRNVGGNNARNRFYNVVDVPGMWYRDYVPDEQNDKGN